MMKNVLIADGETMLTDFLVPYLKQEFPDFVFSRVASVAQAQEQIFQQVFDVVIADLLGMETSGAFLIQELHRKSPGTACIALSTEVHSFWVNRALNDGALGFVSKSAPCIEVVNALKAVLQGRRYISPDVAHCLIKHLSSNSNLCPLSSLSTRELEVFIQVGQGKSFKAISEALNISVKTVAVHKHRIAKKTGINSSAKIVRFCAEDGLLGIPATRKVLPAMEQEPPESNFLMSRQMPGLQGLTTAKPQAAASPTASHARYTARAEMVHDGRCAR